MRPMRIQNHCHSSHFLLDFFLKLWQSCSFAGQIKHLCRISGRSGGLRRPFFLAGLVSPGVTVMSVLDLQKYDGMLVFLDLIFQFLEPSLASRSAFSAETVRHQLPASHSFRKSRVERAQHSQLIRGTPDSRQAHSRVHQLVQSWVSQEPLVTRG